MANFFLLALLIKMRTKNTPLPTGVFVPSEIMKEVDGFIAENAIRLMLEKLLADRGANTRKTFLEISDPKEPFFQGMVAKIISAMSDPLKTQFHLIYRETAGDDNLIIYVTHLIEMYSMILVNRVKLYEKLANDENDKAVQTEDGLPIVEDIRDFVDNMLVESMMTDMSSFSNIFNTLGKKEETKPAK